MKVINIPALILVTVGVGAAAYGYVYIKMGRETAEGISAGVIGFIGALLLALSKFRVDDNEIAPPAPVVVVAPPVVAPPVVVDQTPPPVTTDTVQ